MTMRDSLLSFCHLPLFDAAMQFLEHVGVKCSTQTAEPIPFLGYYAEAAKDAGAEVPKSLKKVFARIDATYFVGVVNDETLGGQTDAVDFKAEAEKEKYDGMFVFAVEMKDGEPLTRTEAALITRGFNRFARQNPATVLIVEGRGVGARLSIATCERTPYKQDWRPGEKLGRVSILKGIDCSDPHRGHLDILESMDVKKCKTFDALYAQWQKVFSTSILTNKFYRELFDWYCWAIDKKSGVYFPNRPDDKTDDYEGIDTKMIRLITRVMFVWFIKQKDLVPAQLFKGDELKKILKDFDPLATDSGCYYNAILQNLFFATLNRAIEDEDGKRRFAEAKNQVDAKNLYRYDEMFSISRDEIVKLFAEVPFVNGSLFDCLDKTKGNDGVDKAYYADGFSRNDKVVEQTHHFKYRAFVPNRLFFDPERGLFSIFDRYAFTVEENTPLEQQVALDPELLGKVFENLLGVYNPETQETARKQSGSFYTPREIVDYMVDESLIAYLGDTPFVRNLFAPNFKYQEEDELNYAEVSKKLKAVKVLDPACGSGAFPVGMLNRIVEILNRLLPKKSKVNVFSLKRYIIENCIYGSDIQCIAAQITKLRFFISLIVNCEKDLTKPNFGIPELPNLETKFVAANSLVGVSKAAYELHDPQIDVVKEQLREVRHKHFNAHTASQKRKLTHEDAALRKKLADLLHSSLTRPEDAEQLVEWNPYDQNTSARFFDPEWMFGIKDGFDIVIGNPPYVVVNGDDPCLPYYTLAYETAHGGKRNLFRLFFELGVKLLCSRGCLCYITPNTFLSGKAGKALRDYFFQHVTFHSLIEYSERDHVFENVAQAVVVSVMTKEIAEPDHAVKLRTSRQGNVVALQSRLQNGDSLIPPDAVMERVFSHEHRVKEYLHGFQGEVNVSTKCAYFSTVKNEGALPLWRGNMVGRYVACGQPYEWCDVAATNRDHFKFPRIITQQVSNQGSKNRTKCCIIPSREMCGHSTNYLFNGSQDTKSLYPWLGILNSRVFEYAFSYANPTNNIPIGKLVEMPVPALDDNNLVSISNLVAQIIAAKKVDPSADTSSLEAEIDSLVFDLYGLTAAERAIVMGKGK